MLLFVFPKAAEEMGVLDQAPIQTPNVSRDRNFGERLGERILFSIIEGLAISIKHLHIELQMLGQIKSSDSKYHCDAWTPPSVIADFFNLQFCPTNQNFSLANLAPIRSLNKRKKRRKSTPSLPRYIFKLLKCQSFTLFFQRKDSISDSIASVFDNRNRLDPAVRERLVAKQNSFILFVL